jgi:hypothetical protein
MESQVQTLPASVVNVTLQPNSTLNPSQKQNSRLGAVLNKEELANCQKSLLASSNNEIFSTRIENSQSQENIASNRGKESNLVLSQPVEHAPKTMEMLLSASDDFTCDNSTCNMTVSKKQEQDDNSSTEDEEKVRKLAPFSVSVFNVLTCGVSFQFRNLTHNKIVSKKDQVSSQKRL